MHAICYHVTIEFSVILFQSALKPCGLLTQLVGWVTNLPALIRLFLFPCNESCFFKCAGCGSACVSGVGRFLLHLRATGSFNYWSRLEHCGQVFGKGVKARKCAQKAKLNKELLVKRNLAGHRGAADLSVSSYTFFFFATQFILIVWAP